MTGFILDPRLENDSLFVLDGPLSQLRLSTNAAFPWLLLVPRRAEIVEIIDLAIGEQEILLTEIRAASDVVKKLFAPKKINVANLGNVVAQLHVHVVARYENDPAWPGPIWGRGITKDYGRGETDKIIADITHEWKI
jgi:diadenosine tetraphosphate (Ap4A) HIT family hydrolase